MHFKALLVSHFSFIGEWLACLLNELGLFLQVQLDGSFLAPTLMKRETQIY